MSFNLCLLPRDEKYRVQLDYEASYWAYKATRGKLGRDKVYEAVNARPISEQAYLKQRFEHYLAQMSAMR